MCESGECEVFVSDVFYRELRRCHEPKLGQTLSELSAITLNHLEETDEVRALAVEYVKSGVLKEKDFNDCLHIAHAVVHGCDTISQRREALGTMDKNGANARQCESGMAGHGSRLITLAIGLGMTRSFPGISTTS